MGFALNKLASTIKSNPTLPTSLFLKGRLFHITSRITVVSLALSGTALIESQIGSDLENKLLLFQSRQLDWNYNGPEAPEPIAFLLPIEGNRPIILHTISIMFSANGQARFVGEIIEDEKEYVQWIDVFHNAGEDLVMVFRKENRRLLNVIRNTNATSRKEPRDGKDRAP